MSSMRTERAQNDEVDADEREANCATVRLDAGWYIDRRAHAQRDGALTTHRRDADGQLPPNSSFIERYPRRLFPVTSPALVQDAMASMEALCHCSAICIQN